MALNRPLTVLELIQVQKMFCFNRGYKDLIRDFQHDFNISITKQQAKQFINNRSWREVLTFLTGQDIVPPDAEDEIKAKTAEHKHYELLEEMIKLNKLDEEERNKDLEEFEKDNYYIDESIKYFNFPLYGEIITYRFKEPFLKCFLFDINTKKINKIEDVPISQDLPKFLLRILTKINASKIKTSKTKAQQLEDSLNYYNYITETDNDYKDYKNIFDSNLFKKYNFGFKT